MHVAQAQKEIFVNEAHALIDALLHIVVEDVVSAEPSEPQDGLCWIVGPDASGEFVGMTDALACRQQGQWFFVTPKQGMKVHDKTINAQRQFAETWSTPPVIAAPAGGDVVDAQSRDAIASIITAMRNFGIAAGM